MLPVQLMISLYLFFLGVSGIVTNRRHFLVVIICIEVILLSVNLLFLLYSLQMNDILGLIFAFFILTIAAAESCVGLAIIILYYRNRQNIEFCGKATLRS